MLRVVPGTSLSSPVLVPRVTPDLVNVAPEGGLDHAHDGGPLTEEVVVLERTGSVVDDDSVPVGHVSGNFWELCRRWSSIRVSR